MSQFSYHSHTADVQMKVKAETINELFETALKGMSNLMKNNFCNNLSDVNQKIKISVQSVDTTALLIDFLSEALLNSNIHKTIYCALNVETLSENELSAELLGKKIDFFDEDIKAVTYHDAYIEYKNKTEWEASVIFDI